MEKFARALHLRWSWLAWTSPDRPWVFFSFEKTQKTFAFHCIEKVELFTVLIGGNYSGTESI
jgi:hypothetical protein